MEPSVYLVELLIIFGMHLLCWWNSSSVMQLNWATMVRISVLNDALKTMYNAEKRGKRQVLIRPSSKVIIKFLLVMQKHGMDLSWICFLSIGCVIKLAHNECNAFKVLIAILFMFQVTLVSSSMLMITGLARSSLNWMEG